MVGRSGSSGERVEARYAERAERTAPHMLDRARHRRNGEVDVAGHNVRKCRARAFVRHVTELPPDK